jgi:hypothetical protein
MRALAMKQTSSSPPPDLLWKQAQSRAKKHAEKTGIPFHLWLLHSQKVLPFPKKITTDTTTDLHRAFREELLS